MISAIAVPGQTLVYILVNVATGELVDEFRPEQDSKYPARDAKEHFGKNPGPNYRMFIMLGGQDDWKDA